MREAITVALVAVMCLLLGNKVGHESGYAKAMREQAERKAEHHEIMRKVGTCDWAQLMADRIQCKKIERPQR